MALENEGMDVPFNVRGNAEEKLQNIRDIITGLVDAILNLSKISKSTQGGTKEVETAANKTAKALDNESIAAKRAREALARHNQMKAAATQAAKNFNDASSRTALTMGEETRTIDKSSTTIRKRLMAERQLELLQRKGFDATGRRISNYKVEIHSLDAVNQRLYKQALALRTAQVAMAKGIATEKEKILVQGQVAKVQANINKRLTARAVAEETARAAMAKGIATEKEKILLGGRVAAVEANIAKRLEERAMAQEVAASAMAQGIATDKERVLLGGRAAAIDLEINRRLEKKALFEETARRAMAAGVATTKEKTFIENKAAIEMQKYGKNIEATAEKGNRAAFIFRRLFGILAAFTAARYAISGFFLGVKEAIEYNKNIQQAQLGIASLFLSVGQVRDEMGEVVTGAKGLDVALKLARKQTDLLRKDALTTAATFDELLKTYQVGLAPGLAAGLDPDQIRQLAVRISQAAAAIGLPMNQLSEEIRSILAGTIQQRTTRIAAALGITNDDIRNAKKAGELFDFLQKKFEGFGVAGQRAMDQFFGLVTRVQDALKQLLGAAGLGFFEELQKLLKNIFDLMTENKGLTIEPNPKAVKILKSIFDGFEKATKNVREMMSAISGADLDAAAKGLGAVIEWGSIIVIGMMKGILQAFGILKPIASTIRSVFVAITGSLPDADLRDIIARLTQILTLMFIWKSTLSIIQKVYQKTVLTKANLLGIMVALVLASHDLLANFLEIEDLSWGDTFKLLGMEAQNTFEILIAKIKVFYAKATDFITNLLTKPLTTLKKLWLDTAQVILSALSFVSKDANNALQKVYMAQAENVKEFANLTQENTKKAEQELANIEDIAVARMAKLMTQLKAETEERKKSKQATKEEVSAMEKFDGLISLGIQSLQAQASVVEKITTDLEEAQKQVSYKRQFGFNLSPDTIAAIQDYNQAFSEARDVNKQLTNQISQMEDGLTGVRARMETINKDSEEYKQSLAQEHAFIEAINMLEESREGVEKTILDTMLERLTIIREEQLVKDQIARQSGELELKFQQEILKAKKAGATQTELELLATQSQIAALKLEASITNQRYNNDILKQSELFRQTEMTDTQRKTAQDTILELYRQQGLAVDQINQKIEELKLSEQSLKDELNGNMLDGMTRGFAQFAIQFQSNFQAGIEIARGVIESFASFVSDAITTAFDPNSDSTLKERFGQFLQDISNMIIQTLIRLGIAKAMMGLLGGSGAAALAGYGAAGGFEGGIIKPYAKKMSHFAPRAQGLAHGGFVRPKGLHPSDTIPIWAAKNEFMQPVKAVRMYGEKFMTALQHGIIDPASTEALMNATSLTHNSKNTSEGYAEGGVVTEIVSKSEAEKSQSQQSGGEKETIPIAALIANEITMDKILTGGKGSLHRWLHANGYRPQGM